MESAPEEWEYLVKLLASSSEPQADFLRQKWPNLNIRAFAPFTPFALQPQLNALGKQGWELVALQPVIVGTKGDVYIGGGDQREWATDYLCVFKRRRPSAADPQA